MLAQELPPCGALQAVVSRLTLHLVVPLALVSQHVTNPDAPQVDLAAHLWTARAHSFESVFAFTAPLTARVTYRRVVTQWTESVCADNPMEHYKDEWIGLPKADHRDF